LSTFIKQNRKIPQRTVKACKKPLTFDLKEMPLIVAIFSYETLFFRFSFFGITPSMMFTIRNPTTYSDRKLHNVIFKPHPVNDRLVTTQFMARNVMKSTIQNIPSNVL